MVAEGKSAEEICSRLVETRAQSSIYIMGGRLTPAAAAIGTLLRIKPILQIQGQKLDKYAKVRRFSDAKKTMLKAIGNDLETRFAELRKQGKLALFVAHTDNYAAAEQFAQEIREAFPDIPVTDCDPLSLSVSCHIGACRRGFNRLLTRGFQATDKRNFSVAFFSTNTKNTVFASTVF